MHLCSGLADTNTQKRQAAIKEVLAKPENAGFTLEWELADTDATQPAEKRSRDVFSYYKEVDGIVCTGYINAQVLAKTMNERGAKRHRRYRYRRLDGRRSYRERLYVRR